GAGAQGVAPLHAPRGRVPRARPGRAAVPEDVVMVVIGTSLGGLQALQVLLGALPARFPAPLAVVQHRGKASDGGLVTLLQAACRMPVLEPEDKEPLCPGHAYLAPPD